MLDPRRTEHPNVPDLYKVEDGVYESTMPEAKR